MTYKFGQDLVINVKEFPFNAKGDGVTDDAPAFQAAIGFAIANNFGHVFVPPGIYRINSTLTFPSAISLIGLGYNGGGIAQFQTSAIGYPTLMKSFIGDLIHFTGANGIVPASGGGVEGIRIVQTAGQPAATIIGTTGNSVSPIVIQTSAAHNLVTGNTVEITGVVGNTAANNTAGNPANGANPIWTITFVDGTHFSLNGSTGNGSWSSGGTVVHVTGTAIKLDAVDSNHKPGWVKIRKVIIEEDTISGSWTWAVDVDGTNASAGQHRILDTRIQELSTHTSGPTTGACSFVSMNGVAAYCDFNIQGHVYCSGTAAPMQTTILLNNIQLSGNLYLDYVVDTTFVGGELGGTVTSTANATGRCMVMPGQSALLAAGIIDNANPHLGAFWYDDTVLSGGLINGSFRSSKGLALANAQYLAAVTTSPGATGLMGVDGSNTIRIAPYGDLIVGFGSNPGTTNAVAGDFVFTNASTIRWTISANTYRYLASDPDGVSINMILGQDASNIQFGINSVQWLKNLAPTLSQVTPTTDTAAFNMTIRAQNAEAAAVTNRTGGSLFINPGAGATSNGTPGNVTVNMPAPTGSGTEGYFTFERGGTKLVQLGADPGSPTIGGLYAGNITPSGSNHMIVGDGNNTYVNGAISVNLSIAASSYLILTAGNLTMATATVEWNYFVVSPTLTQVAQTTDIATNNLTIQSQAAFAAAATNRTGGTLFLNPGAGATTNGTPGNVIVNIAAATGTGTEGSFVYERAGTATGRIGAYPGSPTFGALWLGTANAVAQTAATLSLLADTSGNTYLNSGGTVTYLGIGGSYIHFITTALFQMGSSLEFRNTITPTIDYQTQGSDIATVAFTIKGQDAFGSSTGTNIIGGTLKLQGGASNSTSSSDNEGGIALYGGPNLMGTFTIASASSAATNDCRFTLGPTAAYFLFAANNTNQFLFFQAVGSGGSVNFSTTNVNYNDNTSTQAMTMPLNATGASGFTWDKGVTFTIQQNAQTTDVATNNMTIQAQAAYASASTNKNGGNLILEGGTAASGGANGQVQIPSQILQQSIILTDGYSGALTLDGVPEVIYTEPAQVASTTYDYVITVVGVDVSDGDTYRADLAFTYQRIGGASPTVVGASPTPLNVRTTGDANTWGGPTIGVSGNSITVSVAGTGGVTAHWVLSFSRIKCS